MMNQGQNVLAGLQILVVEDMVLVADEIEHQLHDFGCRVVGPVGHCAQALEAIERNELAGALLDVNLNGESGLCLADELFKRRVPFIFMTGFDRAFLPMEYRVFACLQKPFTGEQLRELMEKTFLPADSAEVNGSEVANQ